MSQEDLVEFRTEADELLNEAENQLLRVEKGAPFVKSYDAIFRAFHSLKGAAGMLGLDALQRHVHQLEDLFQNYKQSENLKPIEIDFFLRGINATQRLLHGENVEFDYQIPHEEAFLRARSASGPRVFVVDDEADILEILKDELIEAGFNPQCFSGAAEALQAFTSLSPKERPDLILSDYKMPAMTGLGFLRAVRAINFDIPFIFLSAHLTREDLQEAINYQVSAVLDKPIRTDALLPTLHAQYKRSCILKILDDSINLILYQYTDLDQFLRQNKKIEIADKMQKDLRTLLESRRNIRTLPCTLGDPR
jgi:CheY-like chemotaxis protein/HPt (histidine-containing phosphotransfer) domain-containing protein